MPTRVLGSNDMLLVENGGTAAILDPGANQAYVASALPAGLENGALIDLQDGRVLYTGGDFSGVATADAWIWDPNIQVWTRINSMNVARTLHTATVLNSGMVLIAGGLSSTASTVPVTALKSTEIFNPASDQFTLTGSLHAGRAGHTATLLPNGSVLVAGGETQNISPSYLASAEVWNPASGNWAASRNPMALPRYGHTATLLNNGQVLMAGTILPFVDQSCGSVSCATTELYNPGTNSFSVAGTMNSARYNHSAVRLLNGLVLVAGGCCGSGESNLTSSESFDQTASAWSNQAALSLARSNQAAMLLTDGRTIIAGGTAAGTQTEYYAEQSPPADFSSFNLPQAFGTSRAVVLWPRAANQLPIAEGGGGYESFNFITTTVRICVPGTANCRTVNGIQLDSGSTGFRVFSSQLGGVSLPYVTTSGGGMVGDCEQYVSSAVWGAVATADLYIGNENVITMPIQVMDDTGSFVGAPSTCTDGSPLTNTPASFGANGLIGIDVSPYDGGLYYSCLSGTCSSITPAVGQKVPSPISQLNTDGNGSIVTLPPLSSQAPLIPDAAVAAYGTLTLGIGTETNNQPPVGLAVCDTGHGGDLNTLFDGTTLGSSYLDTGTDVLSFSSYSATGLPACASPNTGFYCPAHTTSFSAVISGRTIGSSSITFPVGNAATYLASNPGQPDPYALDAIAEPGSRRTFVWGGPFFFGRSVYIAIDGSTTILGPGPYFAF